MSLKVAINGAAGRMGAELIRLVAEDDALELACALEAGGHEALGADAGEHAHAGTLGVPVTDTLAAAADVLVDFSLPAGTMKCVAECAQKKVPMVIGTTGFSEDELDTIRNAASSIPILTAANMSTGVHVIRALVEKAVKTLGPDFDIEVVEMHHNRKVDAPSGTALFLARAAADAREEKTDFVLGRKGKSKRKPSEIGVHALRGGDVVGDHRVIFAGPSEVVEIRHTALSRTLFARGALRAARFIAGKPAGMYDMEDVLK